MTTQKKKQLIRKRAIEMLKQSHKAALANIDKALNSGAVNIDAWDAESNPAIMPKCIVVAVLQEEAEQHDGRGTSFEKTIKKESRNIKLFI